MPNDPFKRPTIGVLSGYQLYEGTPNGFLEPLFRGMYMAAGERDCNLLLACGIGRASFRDDTQNPPHHPAWPLLAPDNDFVPVGHWNTNGLIVVGPLFSEARKQYIQQLIAAQHPLVFISVDRKTPAVSVDNEKGIRQALEHLCIHHQHRAVAFIAGNTHEMSDSERRLNTYLAGVQQYGLVADDRLIAYGWHNRQGGYDAMRSILNTGVKFTAVLASNDESALGAMQALREAGQRIPQDVAVVGFDDRVEAKAHVPSLTTVHFPIFETGQQAVGLLLKRLAGLADQDERLYVPTRLVIRESCGCQSVSVDVTTAPEETSTRAQVAQALSEAVFAEVQQLGPAEVAESCTQLLDAFHISLESGSATPFHAAWEKIMQQVEAANDDPQAWQVAIAILRERWPQFTDTLTFREKYQQAEAMFIQALMLSGKSMQRRQSYAMVRQGQISNQVGLATAQLLTALNETQILEILARRLPHIGIRNLHVAFFTPDSDDPMGGSRLSVLGDNAASAAHFAFPTYQFPPSGLYPEASPFRLALLPLVFQDQHQGYVAFDAANLEPCAAIVRQLAAAFQNVHLYQETLAGRQAAEEANRLKSRFLSTVSHELRTPLNLIVGMSEMLLREQTVVARDDLKKIHNNAQHLGWLIRDVLDLASSEAGQLRLTCEALNLAEVLPVIIATGEQLAQAKGLAWQVNIPENLPLIWGDQARLQQVALNLVSNAVKFTAQGRVSLRVDVLAGSVRVSVSDTGLGIPPAEQDFIFDEFRQSERTTARGFGGMGLGLAICKRLVELHHGQIGVDSLGPEGSGSTFYFTLPIMEGTIPISEASSPTWQVVLVLSEQPGSGKALCEHLLRQGFEAIEYSVTAADDWLPQLLVTPPGAVVLDPGLASERGWEVLKILKGNTATQDIPILFYSMMPEQDAGFVLEMDYLTKPMGSIELAHALTRQGWPLGENPEAKTVLIVEDEPDILEMHARMVKLQSDAYRTLKARNGREALSILQQTQPDLVLLDLMMPELDGFAVLEAMREREATRSIPVIVLTAQVLREADMARLNRGVATILNKGLFSVQETLMHIETALSRSRNLGSKAQRLVRKAMAYIHENYAEPLDRENIANHTGVSPGYLDLCFRQEISLTPMTYLNRYRVNQAKVLLSDGEMNLTEIALTVGFADSAHFSHVFRREVGLSPSAYRRKDRE